MGNPSCIAAAQIRASRPAFAASALCAMCLALVGCGGSSLNRGANYYSEKRYIDAAQVFEHAEPELVAYDDAQRARYGLYRGATLLELGDMSEAERWLMFGHQLAAKNPRALSESERAALREALSSARARQASHAASPVNAAALDESSEAPAPAVRTPASVLPDSTRF
jgi:tetratricopeptide (TPR) repeat protein